MCATCTVIEFTYHVKLKVGSTGTNIGEFFVKSAISVKFKSQSGGVPVLVPPQWLKCHLILLQYV